MPLIDFKRQDKSSNKKLIYCSFGTLFNKNVEAYLTVLNGVSQLSEESNGDTRIKLLMSTGNESYDKIQEIVKSSSSSFKKKLISSILIMSRVPQLDVLKRASLFITHAGQNSTSESIRYGVPIIFVPMGAEQPAVAYRVAVVLGRGIRLDAATLSPSQVKEAVSKVFANSFYADRSCLYSQLSKKYNGPVEGARLIVKHLEESLKKKIS